MTAARRGGWRRGRSAFTLIELLAVMGILILLAVLTVAGVGRIAEDARISTAVNRVSAALGNARAIAIRENELVLVVFRGSWPVDSSQVVSPPLNPGEEQVTEIVTARYSGVTEVISETFRDLSQRFVPVPGVAPVRLPAGIKVGGPNYEWEDSQYDSPGYYTQPDFRASANGCAEYPEYYRMIGVLFGPDGRRLVRLPGGTSSREKIFVDFNGIDADGDSDGSLGDRAYRFPGGCTLSGFALYHVCDHPLDETNVFLVPSLMVYDDDAARELRVTPWATRAQIEQELVGRDTGFIEQYGQRIDFNPSTGVVQP